MGEKTKKTDDMKKFIIGFTILILSLTMLQYPEEEKNSDKKSSEERRMLLMELEDVDNTTSKFQINAFLFPEKRELRCEEILRFSNSSEKDINRILLNLPYNAFRDRNSTFFKESGMHRLSAKQISALKFGEIDINSITVINSGETFRKNIKYISPDDENINDRTVAVISLKEPLRSGSSIWVKIRFRLLLPEIFFKTGQADDYIFLSHWYPRIGVLNRDGSWNVHQFHRRDRFINDFGDYNVKISVPGNYILGSTGNVLKTSVTAKGRMEYEISAKQVHDFVLVAYPHFKVKRRKITLPGNGFETEVILLLSPGHFGAASRYMGAAVYALTYMSENVAPYPYKTFTIVDPPLKGFNSAGYRYPGLITTAYLKLFPYSLKITEMSVFQGVAGQYWFGMVSSPEFEGVSMQEAMASFFEMEIMESYFKNRPSFFSSLFMDVNDWEFKRFIYLTLNPLSKPEGVAMSFLMNKCYFSNINFSISLLLRSLKNYIGRDKFFGFFEHYFKNNKFTLSGRKAFFSSFNTYFEDDYSWAFNQFAEKYAVLDTAVHSVNSDPIPSKHGQYRNEAVFVRNSGYFPVELRIKLGNGKEVRFFWKEKEKWKKIVFDAAAPIVLAEVDPELKIPLDSNLVNNSKKRDKGIGNFKGAILKFGFIFQNILGFLPI